MVEYVYVFGKYDAGERTLLSFGRETRYERYRQQGFVGRSQYDAYVVNQRAVRIHDKTAARFRNDLSVAEIGYPDLYDVRRIAVVLFRFLMRLGQKRVQPAFGRVIMAAASPQ